MDTSWNHLSAPDLGGDAWLGYAAKARGEVTSLLDNMVKQSQKQQELEDARYNADMGVELSKWENSLKNALGQTELEENMRHNLITEGQISAKNQADQEAKRKELELKAIELALKGNNKSSDGSNSGNASMSNNAVTAALNAAKEIEKRYGDIKMDFDLSDVGSTFKREHPKEFNRIMKFWSFFPQQMRDRLQRELSQDSWWSRTDSTQSSNVLSQFNNYWDQFLFNIAENYGDLYGAKETIRLANSGLLAAKLAENAGFSRQAGLLKIIQDLGLQDEILKQIGYSTDEINNTRTLLSSQKQQSNAIQAKTKTTRSRNPL